MSIKNKSLLKIILLLTLFVIVVSVLLAGCNMFIENEDFNDTLTQELDSEEFNELSNEEQVNMVYDILELAEKQEQIQNYSYDEKHQLFTFTYSDDRLGGIDLSEINTNKYGSRTEEQSDLSNFSFQLFDVDKAYATAAGKKMHIMYSLEDQFKQSMQDWEKNLNNKGLSTSVDYDTTVDDLKHLGGYDTTVLSMHGSVYQGRPVLCLKEEVTYEKDKKYITEAMYHNIASVYEKDGRFRYWVFPQFFSSNYNDNELANSMILSQCCDFLSDAETHPSGPDLSFPNNFFHAGAKTVSGFYNAVDCPYSDNYARKMVDYMYDGDLSAGDSHTKTLKDIGDSDGDNPPGTPYLYGDNEFSLGDPAARIAREQAEKQAAAAQAQAQAATTNNSRVCTAKALLTVTSSYWQAKHYDGRTCGLSKKDKCLVLQLEQEMDVYAEDHSEIFQRDKSEVKLVKSVKFVNIKGADNSLMQQLYNNKYVKVSFTASYIPDYDDEEREYCDIVGRDLKILEAY